MDNKSQRRVINPNQKAVDANGNPITLSKYLNTVLKQEMHEHKKAGEKSRLKVVKFDDLDKEAERGLESMLGYYDREEILDMAMDILDSTDATLEEAMGIAIESAENKMSDAEKYRRRRLKAEGADTAAARPGKYSGLSHEAPYYDKPDPRVVAERHVNKSGYSRADRLSQGGNYGKKGYMPRSYDGMSQREKNKIDRSVDRFVDKQHGLTSKQRKA